MLALDTATTSVVVGVVDTTASAEPGPSAVAVLATRTVLSGNRHAETLGVLIADVLSAAGVGMTELSAVVVGLGPGPFTGLRVGIVSAAAMADALGRPAYGACTHDAIASTHKAFAGSVPHETRVPGDGFVVVTDARRRECYWAAYDAAATRISGPHVERPADVVARPDWRPDGLVIGDPAFAEALGTDVQGAEPAAVGLVLAAVGLLHGAPPEPLQPLYLRRPDATPPAARKPVTRR